MWPFKRRKKTPKGYAIVSEKEAQVDPYPYICVNADGSARELHQDERRYLETRFSPFDGARPYVKSRYARKNGWGEIAGFLKRSQLPSGIEIGAAPAENPSKNLNREEHIEFLRKKGLWVDENADGSIRVTRPK